MLKPGRAPATFRFYHNALTYEATLPNNNNITSLPSWHLLTHNLHKWHLPFLNLNKEIAGKGRLDKAPWSPLTAERNSNKNTWYLFRQIVSATLFNSKIALVVSKNKKKRQHNNVHNSTFAVILKNSAEVLCDWFWTFLVQWHQGRSQDHRKHLRWWAL